MKISKLFHWLYATLMFLPIIFFVPSCLYYSFNEHATNTETTTINYKYESNEVNSLDDLIEGNIYYLDEFVVQSGYTDFSIYILKFENISFQGAFSTDDITYLTYGDLQFYTDSDFAYFILKQGLQIDLSYDLTDFPISFSGFYFLYDSTFYDYLDELTILPQYTDYNVIESVSVNTDDTITDKVAYAWESIWNLPLFAWTHNSFVAAPFSYITGLFGVGSDNTLNYVFAYFVSISICWLVFDLVMYVPNLAHRWLDRSSLE